jgi:DivIVA domain-containing protein
MPADGGDRPLGDPRFDVVLRGYDRRQVDEHLSRLQRAVNVMRTGLDSAQAVPTPTGVPGARPRPTPRPRPDGLAPGGDRSDVVGAFTDRMQAIVQAAEREAGEIRGKVQAAARAEEERAAAARAAARAAEETARTSLVELVRQRDAVLADLTRVRGQLEALLSGPTTRITPPTQRTGSAVEVRRGAGAGQPLPDPVRANTSRPDAVADPSDAEQAPVAQTVERTAVVPPTEQSAEAPP